MSQSDDSIQSESLVTYSFSFLFNKLEKVNSFLFPLFNLVKKTCWQVISTTQNLYVSRKLNISVALYGWKIFKLETEH